MPDKKEIPTLIPPHGGYRDLRSYQMAEIVYDATVVFCDRFIPKKFFTHGQMVQAARSGKQNIAEGCMAFCLIHQTSFLLDQLLRLLEKEFLEEGGFTERLYRTRSDVRSRRSRKS